MKKNIIRILFAIVAATLIISSLPANFAAPIINYSDKEYSAYANIDGAINVPTIFRQDAGFLNDGRFPLVIQDGVEYVPLEIFLGFSGVIIEYPEETLGFYIHNKKKNMYISFDFSTGYAVSNTQGTKLLETKIFYNVIYVPLRETAASSGLYTASYIDKTQKLYCVRIYDDSAKKSLNDLVGEYLSKISGNAKPPEQTSPVNPPVTPTPQPVSPQPPKVEKPEVQEPVPMVTAHNLYLAFSDAPNETTERILDMLGAWGVKATFFCNADGMKKYPGLLRKMIVEGHTIGICMGKNVSTDENTMITADTLTEDIMYANGLLKQLTKSCAMLYLVPEGLDGGLDFNDICTKAKVLPVEPSILCHDNTTEGNLLVAAYITDSFFEIDDDGITEDEIILFHSTAKTSDVLYRLLDFSYRNYQQIHIKRLSQAVNTGLLNLMQ